MAKSKRTRVAPWRAGELTSMLAAMIVHDAAKTWQDRVQAYTWQAGKEGRTADEGVAHFKMDHKQTTIRPRFTQLARMGVLIKTDTARKNRNGNYEAVYVHRDFQ